MLASYNWNWLQMSSVTGRMLGYMKWYEHYTMIIILTLYYSTHQRSAQVGWPTGRAEKKEARAGSDV